MLRLTPVVQNLLIITVIVFIAQKLAPITGYLALHNVDTTSFRPYQLFTYMFCHHDFMHILFNMMGLIFFGPALEDFWGPRKFIVFYTICGVGAGIFNILMDLFLGVGSFGTMIGASGAVYGVLTAFGITFPNMQLSLLFLPFSFKAKYLVMGLGAMAIYSSFSSPGDSIAHLAHLGGIVVAILWIQFSPRS